MLPRRVFAAARVSLVVLLVVLIGAVRAQAQLPPISLGGAASKCGDANGTIIVRANFGMGPYTFYLDITAESIGPINTNTYTFENLKGDAAGAGLPYAVFVTDASGTTLEADGNLGDLVSPVIATFPKAASCLNDDGALTISQTSGNSPFTYSINGTDFFANGTFTGLPSGPPAITASVKDVAGCISSMPVTIPLTKDLVINTYNPLPICEGKTIQLPVTSNGQAFSWTPAASLSNASILNPVASPLVTTPYVLTATRGICTLTATTVVTISPAPTADAGPDMPTCYGKPVVLSGSGVANGGAAAAFKFQWAPGTNLLTPTVPFPEVVNPTRTMTYGLTVTDGNGCTSLVADSVTVAVTPPLKVVAKPSDTIVYVGQPVQLTAVGPVDPGGSSYLWTPGTGLSNPTVQSPVAVLSAPQEVRYVVQVTTSIGCAGTDTVVVKALAVADIFVPNAFSPNGDGHNDVLRPIMPGIKTLQVFSVYSRFGSLVFTTKNPGVGWDGSLNGRLLEAGVYVWMAMGVDLNGKEVQRKGTVVLVR